MIIQRVIKGVGRLERSDIDQILDEGIRSMWLRQAGAIAPDQIPERLTERNLDWHQNHYVDNDPPPSGEEFYKHTPFISTTAGTVERDTAMQTNLLNPAWIEALRFATAGWQRDGYLLHCYLFILGKKAVAHQGFSEELRELNIYTGFSPYQPEGEITAKILIPPAQIEKAEYWSIDQYWEDVEALRMPAPADIIPNPRYLAAEDYDNIRNLLA